MARSSRFFSRFVPVVLGAGLFCLAAAGCVSQEDYTALKMSHDNMAEQLAAANAEAQRNKALADQIKAQIVNMRVGGDAEAAHVAVLNQRILELESEREELLSKYEALVGRIGQTELPVPLINELTQFAAANPGLVEFDAAHGIVKFKSDVTFASGDAELTPEARSVVGKFAQILNGPIASNYRLEVAGHTDNVPVSSALAKSKGHKDNWFLSSHRAISVAAALRSQGVVDSRLGVTGYADQRPAAPNTDAAGRQQNRRVEVLILPITVSQASTAAAPAQPEAEPAAAASDVPMK